MARTSRARRMGNVPLDPNQLCAHSLEPGFFSKCTHPDGCAHPATSQPRTSSAPILGRCSQFDRFLGALRPKAGRSSTSDRCVFVGTGDTQKGKTRNDGPRRPDAVTREGPGTRLRGPDLTSVAARISPLHTAGAPSSGQAKICIGDAPSLTRLHQLLPSLLSSSHRYAVTGY